MNIKQTLKSWPLFFRSKIGIFEIFFKRLCKESFEDLEFNSNWKFQTRAAFSKLHKSPLLIDSQYSWRRSLISGNWKPFKNYEKCFLFHLNKLDLFLANQVLLILCILIKPNVWLCILIKTNVWLCIWLNQMYNIREVWKYGFRSILQ